MLLTEYNMEILQRTLEICQFDKSVEVVSNIPWDLGIILALSYESYHTSQTKQNNTSVCYANIRNISMGRLLSPEILY